MTASNVLGRIALDYNASRAKPNIWMQNETWDGVLIRFSEALSKEFTGELFVRFRKHHPGALFVRPADAELTAWVSESVVVSDNFARVSFIFGGTPKAIARSLFCEC